MPLSASPLSTNAARYRQQFNPFRGLTLDRAGYMLAAVPEGRLADLMWTLWHVEQQDEDLLALIEQRVGAGLEMDWKVKVVSAERAGFDETLAAEQQSALRGLYERFGDLDALREHFLLASFRSFAIAEIERDENGDPKSFPLIDPWNVARDGLRGAWFYNPSGKDVAARSFGGTVAQDLQAFDPEATLIFERPRSIHRIALLKFIRANLSQKDWDAFLEIYGVPSGVVTLPEGVDDTKAAQFAAAAEEIAKGGAGSLPNGATYKQNTPPTGSAPFKEYTDRLSEKLILAGTGGRLTMLTGATGMGSGVSDSHRDTFRTIARSDARRINEFLQKRIDLPFLARHFPNKPILAYFAQEFAEQVDNTALADQVSKLATAGFKVSREWLTERTGFTFDEPAEPLNLPPRPPQLDPQITQPDRVKLDLSDLALANRATGPADALGLPAAVADADFASLLDVRLEWLAPALPFLHDLEAIAADPRVSAEDFIAHAERRLSDLPELAGSLKTDALANALEARLGRAALAGMGATLQPAA